MELLKNAVCHKHSKHININYHFICKLVKKKEIAIYYLQTSLMPADILTKAPKYRHLRGVQMLNLNKENI